MSMFHELMMRKKEQIMYATIKGTLTENDGVFSGFSASSYLALQHIIDFSKPFELLFKFTSTDFTNPQYLFSTRYNTTSGFDIYIQNSKIRIWGSTNGTSLDISSYSTDTISVNTTYWYKLKYSPTQIIAELSTDGINFVQENNIALSNQIYQNNYNALIGHGQTANTNYFVGSIDLNNSYIKLGSTKYNLQAVVGYTVVGSPTITDGVVSGFSPDNLLTITQINFSKNFEIQTKIKPNSFNLTTLLGGKNYYANGWLLQANGTVRFKFRLYDGETYKDTSFFVSKILTIGNIYILNAKRVNRNISFSVYENGVLYDSGSYEIPEGFEFTTYLEGNYGIGASTNNISPLGFDGEIYVQNDTFIKFDNKMWFNGYER